MESVTNNPKLYNSASKRDRALIRDLRLKRIELILGVRIPDPTIMDRFQVMLTRQLLFEGQKYIGPGTNLKLYLQRGTLPKSRLDAGALKHDLAYLYAASFPSPATRKYLVNQADAELLELAREIEASAESEAAVYNARLTLRLLGDLKPAVEEFVHFEGIAHRLNSQEIKDEWSGVEFDLTKLAERNPGNLDYVTALEYLGQMEHVNITHKPSYEEFSRKMESIEMRRRNPPLKDEPVEAGAEEEVKQPRTRNPPGTLERARTEPGLGGVLQETPIVYSSGAEHIINQNEAVARSQERINIQPQVITGDRILRLYAYRDSGLSVIPTDDAKTRNRIYLAKYSRVAEGKGDLGNNLDTLGNQITKPVDNRIIEAWRHSQELRYSGPMFDGGAYIQPKKLPTHEVLERQKVSMVLSTPVSQERIPTTAVGYTKPGHKVNMLYNNSNERWVTPLEYRNTNRLIFPQLVDGLPT